MKSLAKYISKYLLSFSACIIFLLVLNVVCFIATFHSTIMKDYGYTSPQNMLEVVSEASSESGTTAAVQSLLHEHQIWAIYLTQDGETAWSYEAPAELPEHYTIQDIALFSKGYLKDYPVFVWDDEDGLLVLGYPKGSYTKFTTNYFSAKAIQKMPVFLTFLLFFDLALLFAAYFLSKHKIIKNTEPIIASIQTLAEGKPAALAANGELSELASSVNKASQILSRQNEARENWISGVSHDIRTPLSMIMGYAQRIAQDEAASTSIREEAQIVQRQSAKIKELVLDLNLVSKLEYDMQPLHKEPVRLAKLLRSYVAEVLNAGIPENCSLEISVDEAAETKQFDCDSRLMKRAVNNLVQNSFGHNPQGCHILILLTCTEETITISVKDDGVGFSADKLKELEEKPHYMDSTDERLDLRHGLGLLLVRRITQAHNGIMTIKSKPNAGCETILSFSTQE
ncbi:MAG: HAMP domain-containing histidine kinase [Oscillospiraceae bacterium]|nr:HAMP domain-containing histidine kinase [Oscillospiraceae bacterium]